MRHGIKGKKLNLTASHRKAMFKNMSVSIIMHEQIKTTLPKAKAIRPVLEKLVTKAKRSSDLSTRRALLASLGGNDVAVNKLFNVLAVRYAKRPGGYLRIIKAGNRFGDMAEVAYIEFVDRDQSAKGCDPKGVKLAAPVDVKLKEEVVAEPKKETKAVKAEKPMVKETKSKVEKQIVKPTKIAGAAKKAKTKQGDR